MANVRLMGAFFTVLFCSTITISQPGSQGSISGTVKDPDGAIVTGANVSLRHAQQAIVRTTTTDASGRFSFENVPVGSYQVLVEQAGFDQQTTAARVTSGRPTDLEIFLQVASVSSQVTVTAETGQAEEKDRIPQAVNIVSERGIQERTTGVLAQIADEEVGLALQRTSPTIAGVFVRGLVGNKVAVYVDGVRYTTSAMRGGINTFLDLNDPSNLSTFEVLRGPNGAQYGSDSIGGTLQLVSHTPNLGSAKPETHGQINTFFTSADLSFGGNTLVSYGTKRFGLLLNAAARRVNTLRPGHGLDPHSSITRFLGLPSNILGDRLTDTAFTQYGGMVRLSYAPDSDQQLTFHYQRGQQDGGKRYDQTLGGDGNLIADLRNLMSDFAYGRYLKQGVGIFDNLSITGSYNAQREERVNQGGQGNPVGDITHQYERTRVFGFSAFLDKQLSRTNTILLGTDFYDERVKAPAYTLNPVSRAVTLSRPRVPHGAKYDLFGLFVQDVYEVNKHLRLSGALRFNRASYESRAANSPIVSGKPLWPDDNLKAHDFSGRIGAVISPNEHFGIVFNYSRGFRAPNITDLGTLGLTGDGFEADFTSSSALGGTIGTTAGTDAVTTGIALQQQHSEVSNNFDAGFRFRHKRFDTDFTWFLTDINGAIVKQTLILPAGSVGKFLGDQQINSQDPRGWVTVPASGSTPVLIRTNFTDARIWGVEYTVDARLHRNWMFGGNFTYVHAEDKATGLPPNIEGGTPPPTGFLRLRYEPAGRRFWIEGYSTLADRQSRLSSLDLGDRRTGATRSTGQIQNFFRRGACVRGLTTPGPTGCGSAGGILIATGETLAQVQTRVLGSPTASPKPLFDHIPGYGLINVRGGYRFERSEISIDFENITDKNYRGLAWGIEGPGRSVTARYRFRF
ncbi:MAG TPA: TonB-dependent receptor [Pyrinomonadaceae bacterium]|jgi:outer membrane receptor protein involved in Fe transport